MNEAGTAIDAHHAAPGSAPRAVYAVFRHECRQLVHSPLTYIFQIGFLTTLVVCIFFVADFYQSNDASLRLLLTFLPWLAVVFVPALAMRSWGEGAGARSIELTLTLPLTAYQVIVGKFLAGAAILALTLAYTWPFVGTLYYLGEPDGGVVAAGYIASFAVLLAAYGVGLLGAVMTREPVAAFVTATGLLFALMLLGWDAAARLAGDFVDPGFQSAIQLASPKFWFDRLAKGLIEPAAVFYFLALVAVCLASAAWIVRRRKLERPGTGARLSGAALVVAIPVLVVGGAVAFWALPGKLDLTAAREFSLHEGTRNILDRLPEGVQADLYWSRSEASVPVRIKSHARRVIDQIETMARQAGGAMTVRMRDPAPDTETELGALAAGVQKIPMTSGDYFYLGATFRHGDRVARIPYFDMRREQLLEYDIARALNGLTRERTPNVGLLSPLLLPRHATEGREGLSFLQELKDGYNLAVVPHFSSKLPGDLDVLVLVDASVLRHEMLYEIDQFVMNGGALIVLVDPRVRFNRPSDMVNPEPSEEINDISDLLLRYGMRYLHDEVVGDAEAASVVVDSAERQIAYPYWLRLREAGLSGTQPVTADLNEILLAEPGALELTRPAGGNARVSPLVRTSTRSGVQSRTSFRTSNAEALAAAFSPDGNTRVLAAIAQGRFASAFANAPKTEAEDGAEAGRGAAHRATSAESARVMAVGDVDWIFDAFAVQTLARDGGTLTRPLNDNHTFLLNMIAYAAGDPALVSIRSRGRVSRTFTRTESMLAQARAEHSEQERALMARIAQVEQTLEKIPEAAGVSRLEDLPAEVRKRVRDLQAGLLPERRRLREIRLEIRREVEGLGRRIALFNLAAGPFFVLVFAGLVRVMRRRSR